MTTRTSRQRGRRRSDRPQNRSGSARQPKCQCPAPPPALDALRAGVVRAGDAALLMGAGITAGVASLDALDRAVIQTYAEPAYDLAKAAVMCPHCGRQRQATKTQITITFLSSVIQQQTLAYALCLQELADATGVTIEQAATRINSIVGV